MARDGAEDDGYGSLSTSGNAERPLPAGSNSLYKGDIMLRLIALGTVVALVAVASAAGGVAKGGNSLHAKLSGKVEVPKGDPDGSGTAEVKINGTSVCWEIKASKVATLMAAHIHKGGTGVAGPVIVPFGKTYKGKGCATTTAAVAAAIKKNPGAYYVNVHNAKYPAGALRGQLQSDG
jgi:CHRD domain